MMTSEMMPTEWTAIASACPIPIEELPIAGSSREQVAFLRHYLAHVRASDHYECYECYECLERVLAKLEDAATSPFMDA